MTVVFAVLLTSCTNDEIPVQNATKITVNMSSVMKNFTYQINAGDLDGVDSDHKLRVRLFVYDSNGKLFAKDETSVRNYLTSATFEVNLKANEPYKTIVVTDVTTEKPGLVAEFWSISDENSISTLKVNYLGEDSNYGDQEILGIASNTILSGDDVSINVEAAGALVCTLSQNLHAYSNLGGILIYGGRGNGFFNFDNSGDFKENPDLESNPSFTNIDVEKSGYGIYTYKFLMPQTNFDIVIGFSDTDGEILDAKRIDAVKLEKGKEYLIHLLLDPNNNGDGICLYSFDEVSNKNYSGHSSASPKEKSISDVIIKTEVKNKESNDVSYKVIDLL